MPREHEAASRFPTTRASLILAVRQPEFRAEALEAITEIYWKPVYKYARLKWRRSPEDTQDLTQDFFASLLERDLLARWEPDRASFRTYIRLCLDSHAKNALTASNRLKRGGGAVISSLDFQNAETELSLASQEQTPEDLFHREWQRRLFELAVSDLEAHCRSTGRSVQWRVFASFDLAADERPTYERLATTVNLPVTTITNHLAWARRELRRMLLLRLARATGAGTELRREARDLLHPVKP
jgi:RNA polymerase sigma factor (sigma-70 family)